MTQPEELALIKKLRDELDRVRTEKNKLQVEVDELTDRINSYNYDRAYDKGLIAGLVFSVRCNGVSGDEINSLDLLG